jgi:hypothetical protein
VDTARTSTEEFVKGLPTYRCTVVEQINTYCTGGVALKKKTINYMSEGGEVKPTKAYLEASFIISVTGTQQEQQPGTSVRMDYLQTTFETGKDNRSTYVSAGVSLFNALADKRNELTGTSKSNKKLVTATF